MENNKYQKPVMFVEKFVPQEFIAACTPERVYKGWKAYGSDMIISGTLYHDENGDRCYRTALWSQAQSNEKKTLPSGSVPTGASATDDDNYIAGAVPSYNGNDGNWYTGYDNDLGILTYWNLLDSNKFTTKFFVYNGYYIKDVKEVWRTEKSQS